MRLPSLALAGALVAHAGSAAAQASEKLRTAQALYDKAVSALDRKDFATACPMLEEVVRLEPSGIGAKITLAECYEGAGKLASASATYELAEAAAAAAGQTERQRKAHDRAAALQARRAHLTVVVPPEIQALPGLDIQRDGVPVGQAQWGLRLPADKGEHHVIAVARGKQRWEQVVVLVDGMDSSVTVGPMADGSGGPSGGSRGPFVAGIVVGAVGVPLVVTASVFGMMAIGKKNDSAPHCTGNVCDMTGFQLRNDGRTDGNVSTALFVAGGAMVAAGVTLIAVGATRPSSPTSAQITLGPGHIGIRGSF